ncbi:hypothetical protein [Corynebacterium choanae]|nr:hypothetical protein [Corynebacterium choanae]
MVRPQAVQRNIELCLLRRKRYPTVGMKKPAHHGDAARGRDIS